MQFLKRLIQLFLGPRLGTKLINVVHMYKFSKGSLSFSQEGEDRVLANLFRDQKHGFYVDIGAHHPYCLSNSNIFYQQGWTGINIDANPELINDFQAERPRDINLAVGIGNNLGEMTFYQFEEPALSSFDEKLSKKRESEGRKIKSTIKVKIHPLKEILSQHLKPGTEIDFMNVDVEGFDLEVLQSNDWNKFKPKYLLVECLGLNLENVQGNETYQFLNQKGYMLLSKLINTCVFERI